MNIINYGYNEVNPLVPRTLLYTSFTAYICQTCVKILMMTSVIKFNQILLKIRVPLTLTFSILLLAYLRHCCLMIYNIFIIHFILQYL